LISGSDQGCIDKQLYSEESKRAPTGGRCRLTGFNDLVVGLLYVGSYFVSCFFDAVDGLDTSPFGYSGEYTDVTGQVYLRARYYDPSMGRFSQLDPSRQEMNPYQYSMSNPVIYVDPTGLCTMGLDCPTSLPPSYSLPSNMPAKSRPVRPFWDSELFEPTPVWNSSLFEKARNIELAEQCVMGVCGYEGTPITVMGVGDDTRFTSPNANLNGADYYHSTSIPGDQTALVISVGQTYGSDYYGYVESVDFIWHQDRAKFFNTQGKVSTVDETGPVSVTGYPEYLDPQAGLSLNVGIIVGMNTIDDYLGYFNTTDFGLGSYTQGSDAFGNNSSNIFGFSYPIFSTSLTEFATGSYTTNTTAMQSWGEFMLGTSVHSRLIDSATKRAERFLDIYQLNGQIEQAPCSGSNNSFMPPYY